MDSFQETLLTLCRLYRIKHKPIRRDSHYGSYAISTRMLAQATYTHKGRTGISTPRQIDREVVSCPSRQVKK